MTQRADTPSIGTGALITNDHGEVLLLLRSENHQDSNQWSKPGGRIEFGETIEAALRREVMEEIGCEIEIGDFLHIMQNIGEKWHWIYLTYLAKIKSGELKNLEPAKHKDLRWFTLDNLPENLTSGARLSILEYKKWLKKK